MTDQTTTTPSTSETAPPWGDDFDPARAWNLVQNLRAERDKARADRDALAEQVKTFDAERATLTERAQSAERSLWVEAALRKHPLRPDLSPTAEADALAFLTGDSAEEIERKAATLAALGAKGSPSPATPDAGLTSRPSPRLTATPGHGDDSGDAPKDLDALAASITSRQS